MFSGIINYTGKIKKAKKIFQKGKILGMELTIEAPKSIFNRLKIGSSLLTNGVCLTVLKMRNAGGSTIIETFLMNETLRLTSFKTAKKNDVLNLEPSLRLGDEVSGHFVFGHVDAVGKIYAIAKDGASKILTVVIPAKLKKFFPSKGSVALDGISLTIIQNPKHAPKNSISVSLIPHTLKVTNLRDKKLGSLINVEVDMLSRYAQGSVKLGL